MNCKKKVGLSVLVFICVMVSFFDIVFANQGDYSFPSGAVFYHSLREVSSLSKDLQSYLSGFSDTGGRGLGDTIAFNRFIDDTGLGQLRGWIPKSGEPGYCNPSGSPDKCHKTRMQYAYDNTDPQGNRLTIYTDNRDFVTAKKMENASEYTRQGKYYHNVQNLKLSDLIMVFVYLNNNASAQPGKAEALTAKNTKVAVDFSNPQKLKAVISARNIAPISDIVTLGVPSGSKLEYLAGLLTGFTTNSYTAPAHLIDEISVSPVSGTATTAEFNIGDVVAGEVDSKWLYLKFRVIADKDTPDKSEKSNTRSEKCSKEEIKKLVEKGFSVQEALELCEGKN